MDSIDIDVTKLEVIISSDDGFEKTEIIALPQLSKKVYLILNKEGALTYEEGNIVDKEVWVHVKSYLDSFKELLDSDDDFSVDYGFIEKKVTLN